MTRIPGPQAFAAGLSGFVLGVIVTLVATGSLVKGSAAKPNAPPTLPPPVSLGDAGFYNRVHRIVLDRLGPPADENLKQGRLIDLQVQSPSQTGNPSATGDSPAARYRSIKVTFRLNDHPLGKVWRLRAAKADVFGVLKGLYTSRLPIYSVRLVGVFPLTVKRKKRAVSAVVAFMSHAGALKVPWKHWGREKESQLWQNLTFKSVNREFG